MESQRHVTLAATQEPFYSCQMWVRAGTQQRSRRRLLGRGRVCAVLLRRVLTQWVE